MVDTPLQLTLTAGDRPGRFTVANGSISYPIEFRPETDVVLGDLLRRLRPVLVGGSDPSGQLAPLALLREIGTRLWQALLPGTAPADLRETLVRELRTGMTPLLLGLPQNLAPLPWELLCDPERPDDTGFLARRRPLVRLVSGGNDLSPLAPPLRVLLLISSPPGLNERERVDVESERAAVEQATRTFREAGLLHLLVEDIVTLRRVQQALLRFKPDILHYIGHGTYEEDLGGFLLWEDEQGHPLPVPDTRIADMFRPRGLRAVLLHGCETAISDEHTDFRGVAGVLTEAGIPAVVAQQANFTYESSQRASEMFYTALTSGQSIAEATFEARQALAYADRPDWAVPTLQATTGGLLPLLDPAASPDVSDPALERGGASADLPAPTGVFVGRQRELRALRVMLESAPGPVLALMTGPGGVGKSTLAAQAVTRYGERFKATLTLRCAGYQGIDLFLQQIAEFLQRQGSPGLLTDILPDPKLSVETKIDAAIEMLDKAGPFLLLVDNLESVQRDDRTLADSSLLLFLQRLLTNLRSGRTLITGRYVVKDLLPHGKFAASLLQLDLDDLSVYEIFQLLSRHTALAHLSETERAEVVREFGGLPYVYDLLSSQAASRSLGGLIHDVQGRITRERAQRSAHEWEQIRRQVVEFAALESTVARLPERSQTLLGELSLFRSSFPLQALEQGLAAVEDEWKPLLDWGLLRFDPVDGDYHLHSLTAHYAQDLLNATDRAATQVQLAEWYLRYVREESHDLADYLEAHRLLRAAGEVERAGELALNLGEVLSRFGLYQLWRELCTATITDVETTHESLRSATLHQLGNIALDQGEYAEARRLYSESLAIKERLGDQGGRAMTLHQLGNIAKDQGEYEEARRLYSESLTISERLGNQGGRAGTLHQLGMIAQDQGEYEEARRLYSESLTISERLGNQGGRANTLHQLGNIAYLQGEYEEARRLYSEVLTISERLGDQGGRASTLHQLGLLAHRQQDFPAALQYTAQALAIFERLRSPSRELALRELTQLRSELGETAFVRLWQETMSGQPLPDLRAVDQRQVTLQHLVAFIQAQAWEEKKSLLEGSPDLLSAEADTLLEELAAAQQEEGARRLIEQHRALLRRCRTWGIDPAWYYTFGMRLGNDGALPVEHEAAVMQIASLLAAHQHENGTALERAIEAMQQLLNRLTAETPPLFEAALLRDLADVMGRLPAGHPVRKLEQMEAYYREALPAYQAADRPLSVLSIQRSLSSVLREQGRYDEALEFLESAIADLRAREQDRGKVAWALADYASALDNLGRVEDALAAYNEALTLLPDMPALYRNRAETFIHARRLDEAEADLAHAVELDGNENSAYLWYRRAQLAIARGDGLGAQQMVDEVLKRDASQEVGLLRVQVAWLQGDVPAAQEVLQRVWEKASPGERVSMGRELGQLFDEHAELAGRDVLVGIMRD